MTVAEVAEMMRVSTMTVYRLIKGGELPAVRFGKSYRLDEADVDALPGEPVHQSRLEPCATERSPSFPTMG